MEQERDTSLQDLTPFSRVLENNQPDPFRCEEMNASPATEKHFTELLANGLQPRLALFESECNSEIAGLRSILRFDSNPNFLLRAQLAFRVDSNDEELALVVDAQRRKAEIEVACDLCFDDGRIVSSGPILAGSIDANEGQSVAHWLTEFDEFLILAKGAIRQFAQHT